MIRALGQHVFVQKDAYQPLSVGGVLIPEQSERTPRFSPTILGTVVSAGPRCHSVKRGDRVALKNVAGDDLFIRGDVLCHLRERDLVGLAYESP